MHQMIADMPFWVGRSSLQARAVCRVIFYSGVAGRESIQITIGDHVRASTLVKIKKRGNIWLRLGGGRGHEGANALKKGKNQGTPIRRARGTHQ